MLLNVNNYQKLYNIFSDTEGWILSTFDGTSFTDDPSMLVRHPKSTKTFAILCEQGGSG